MRGGEGVQNTKNLPWGGGGNGCSSGTTQSAQRKSEPKKGEESGERQPGNACMLEYTRFWYTERLIGQLKF